MLFVIHGFDKDAPGLRQSLVAEHRAYMEDGPARVVSSGPLMADDGKTMIGSILIVEADSRAQVDQLVAGDPFFKAGLSETLTVTRWYQRFGAFAEG